MFILFLVTYDSLNKNMVIPQLYLNSYKAYFCTYLTIEVEKETLVSTILENF